MPVHGRRNFENLYSGQPRCEIVRPQKADDRGLTATFLVIDDLALKNLPEVFVRQSTAGYSTSSVMTTAAHTSKVWRRC
jgi:hypothetical protein